MIEIELTPHNLLSAGLVGVSRYVKDTRKIGTYGADNVTKGWQMHCEGACGELAVAKHYGVFYDGALGNSQAKDAGRSQVRTTHYKSGGLILHEQDASEDVFILVLSHKTPIFILQGWLYAQEGKQERFWRADWDRPAYLIPQSELQPMETLETSLVCL